jgi:hypothetical protein
MTVRDHLAPVWAAVIAGMRAIAQSVVDFVS